jgi:hypothetical protein
MAEEKSYLGLADEDLLAFVEVATEELSRFFTVTNSKYTIYREKLLGVCLCQGAAQQYPDCATRENAAEAGAPQAYYGGV